MWHNYILYSTPVYNTVNGASLKLHHVPGERSSLVRKYILDLQKTNEEVYNMWKELQVNQTVGLREQMSVLLSSTFKQNNIV